MQAVEWVDESGRNRRRYVRNVLDDPSEGIPLEPPDVDRMNWERIRVSLSDSLGNVATRLYALNWASVKTELHNQLMDRGLLEWDDVQRMPGPFRGAIMAAMVEPLSGVASGKLLQDAIFAALRRPLLDLYREHLHRG